MRQRSRVFASVAVAIAAATAAAPAADAAPARDRPVLRLFVVGGERQTVQACGAQRRVAVVGQGVDVAARVVGWRVRSAYGRKHPKLRGRRAPSFLVRRPTLVLKVARCDALNASRAVGRAKWRRNSARARGKLPTTQPGDYRVTTEVRARGRVLRRSHAYVRVAPLSRPVDGDLVARPVDERAVTELPVRFTVQNLNRTKLPCPSDGAEYTVSGRLVGTVGALLRPPSAATLYLHEFGWGKFFFQFPRTELDYARDMASRGHVSIVVDRLGYDDSSRPPGTGTCLGSQGDVAHQIVEQMRSGQYAVTGIPTPRFAKVAVGGHSAGGAIAEIAAYSFGDIDALVLFAYADSSFTEASILAANEQGAQCLAGGEPSDPGQPGGYATFAPNGEDWKGFMFSSAAPDVADQALAMRNRDPCGDTASLTPAAVNAQQNVPSITAPVLLLFGTKDAIYKQPAAGEAQRDLFSGSTDVTLQFFEGAGHALTLEAQAPAMRDVVSGWLRQRGF